MAFLFQRWDRVCMGCGIGRFGKYEAKNPTMDLHQRDPWPKDVKWNDTLKSPDKTIGLLPKMQGCKTFFKIVLLLSNSETPWVHGKRDVFPKLLHSDPKKSHDFSMRW